jgi:hypothetical protein
MATRKLTAVEILERFQHRLEKRMEAIQRAKLEGFETVISELEVEQDYLRRATRYWRSEGTRGCAPRYHWNATLGGNHVRQSKRIRPYTRSLRGHGYRRPVGSQRRK